MHVVFAFSLHTALAADPEPSEQVVPASVPAESAWHAARRPELLGASCAASTGMAARRVVEEGVDWRQQGVLDLALDNVDAQISAPFLVRGSGSRIIATSLTDQIAQNRLTGRSLVLVGRSLDVEGVVYVVLTEYRAP